MMRLLFARNELPPETKARAIEICVFLLLWLLVLVMSTGLFGEHFARSGLVAVVSGLMPIQRLAIHWIKRLLLASVIGVAIVSIQGFIAYDLRGYSPTGDLSNPWLFAALVAYMAISGAAFAAGRYFSSGLLPARGH